MSDLQMVERLRWRHLLPLAVLALASILLVQAGSAARPAVYKFQICVQDSTGMPACGGAATSGFPGNQTVAMQVSVENDSTSTTAIQSANVIVPNQLMVVGGTGSPSANVVATTGSQQIQIHGVKIQPGKTFTATVNVNVACGGQFDWPAQQAWSGDTQTGTSFDYQDGTATSPSTGVTTSITTACHIGFATQPTDTQIGSPITDAGASQPGSVKVGLFTGATGTNPMTSCPVGYTTCTVTVSQAPTDGTLSNGSDSLTQALVGTGERVATYSNLSITGVNTPEQFRLKAAATGDFAPTATSTSFLIADNVDPASCDNTGHCTITQKQLQHGSLIDSFADLVGVQNFDFMTLSPFTLGTTPQGCAGRIDLGVTGFAESDNRNDGTTTTTTIRFYVDHDQLSARYGKNVGQQFIEICAGGRPVAADGTIYDCNDLTSPVNHDNVGFNSQGWWGDEVKNGKFTGKPARATCNADGYYWGIIGSYQDKLPAGNPVVTNWGGQNIGGNNYRFFDMTIPPSWDWRSGP